MLQPATPEGKLHHYSTYKNRESIQKNGLLPKVGRQTANYMSHNFPDVEPLPMVFAQDPNHGNFFGVYGSDLWEIDLNQINNNWYHDPIHKDDENKWGFFVTLDPIPPSAIRLISSDEQRDDDMEVYRQTGEYPKRETEEPQKQEEPNKWDDLLNQLGDDDFTFNMDDLKLQESIRRIIKEETETDINIDGGKLKVCSTKPMTGFYRDGYCRTGKDDSGSHTVCARVTEEFLDFTNSMGNNLDMLEPGDKWCLCAKRWEEANEEGVAPKIIRNATNIKTLDIIDSVEQELDEYARTLKNARRQGVGLRFPKSAVKANPSRFRKYSREEQTESEITERCWKGYTQKGMKTMFGKRYPNCVKIKK